MHCISKIFVIACFMTIAISCKAVFDLSKINEDKRKGGVESPLPEKEDEETEATDTVPPDIDDDLLSLSGVNIGDGEITIEWVAARDDNTSTNKLKYEIYYSTSANLDSLANTLANGTKLTDVIGSTTVTVKTLVLDKNYYFNIVVVDSHGNRSLYVNTVFRLSDYQNSNPVLLKASNLGAGDEFSYGRKSIAVDGNTLVIGASLEDSTDGTKNDLGNDQGAAYVFVKNSSGVWEEQAYLKASNADAEDNFGHAVAVSGDTIVVGAYMEDGNGSSESDNSMTRAGAAYVFVRSGTTWTQQAYLKASVPDPSDRFGWVVDIENDVIVVGAQKENSQALDGGGFYIFRRTGVVWAQEKWVSGTVNYADFASSLDLSGDTLAVTGLAYNSGTGNVTVYKYSGSDWLVEQVIVPANGDNADEFGYSVALKGNTMVVGSPSEDSNGSSETDNSLSKSGAAYIYERTGSTWSLINYIKASNPDVDDLFGRAVGIGGDTIVVGARGESSNPSVDESDNSLTSSGAVYLYKKSGANWTQNKMLKSPHPDADDIFGVALAVSDDEIFVCTPREDSASANDPANNSLAESGGVWVFPFW